MKKMLNLPGVIVEECLSTKETIILFVRLKKKTAVCPRCGQISHRLHQNNTHLVRTIQKRSLFFAAEPKNMLSLVLATIIIFYCIS